MSKLSVSTRALVQRVNRALRRSKQRLVAPRGGRAAENRGVYFIVDEHGNVTGGQVDLRALAQDLEVLSVHEVWEPEHGSDAAVLAKLRGDACAAVQGAHGVPGCGECVECLQRRIRAAEGILRRAVIYATEDLMRTPGSTRLARALADAEKWLNP